MLACVHTDPTEEAPSPSPPDYKTSKRQISFRSPGPFLEPAAAANNSYRSNAIEHSSALLPEKIKTYFKTKINELSQGKTSRKFSALIRLSPAVGRGSEPVITRICEMEYSNFLSLLPSTGRVFFSHILPRGKLASHGYIMKHVWISVELRGFARPIKKSLS